MISRAPSRKALVRLGLTEVDLLLIHWPNAQVPMEESSARWRVKQQELARHIGVANYTVALIEAAVATCWSRWCATRSRCIPFSTRPR